MTPNPNPSPELREAIARICFVPDRQSLHGWDSARAMAEQTPRSCTGACVRAAYERADAILALSPQTLPAPGEVEQGTGWVAWNPDSGEEYTPNHPVESGECVEAERIRRSTPQEDTLWTAFQEQFMRAEALQAASLATVAAANDEGVAELRQTLVGLELTEDGYSLRVAYDGDADDDGRAIVVGGETVVTFTDSDEGEAVREAILKIMGKPA